MMGKKSSLIKLKKYLVNEKKINNLSSTQFCQGQTMRWAIAWSFDKKQLNQISFKKCNQKEDILKVQNFRPLKLIINKILPVDNSDTQIDAYEFFKQFILDNLKVIKKILIKNKGFFFFLILKLEIEREEKDLKKIIFNVKEKTWTNRKERRNQRKIGITSENKKLLDNFKVCCEINVLPSKNIEIKLFLDQRNENNSQLKNNLNEIYEFLKYNWKMRNLKK